MKEFKKAELEVIKFDVEDVVAKSGCHGFCESVCPTDCIDICREKCYIVTADGTDLG